MSTITMPELKSAFKFKPQSFFKRIKKLFKKKNPKSKGYFKFYTEEEQRFVKFFYI